jgi:hypothetical protein
LFKTVWKRGVDSTKKEMTMTFEKATKNTIRFQEETVDAPLVGYLYVQKHVFQGNVPQKIKVAIEWG